MNYEIHIEVLQFENILEVQAYLEQEGYELHEDSPNDYLRLTATDPGYRLEHSFVFYDD